MSLHIREAELFGITESSLSLSCVVRDAAGEAVAADLRVRVDGEVRARAPGVAGTVQIRVEGLLPDREHRVEIEADGAAAPEPDAAFPEHVRTLPAPEAECVARFATLNDLHFGEPRFGGVLDADGEYGEEAPGYPLVRETDGDVPYWRVMNEDAVADINAAGVDATVIKGDIADTGQAHQFEWARRTFDGLDAPWHAFLGNHDHYAQLSGDPVDGCAILGQPPAPRCLELGGWRFVLLDTTLPGEHHGVFPEERQAWLARTLAETREAAQPTLLFLHHHPVPSGQEHKYPNSIGLVPKDSHALFEIVGANPQVRAVLIGHTHRNRVRLYPESGDTPFIEVHCVKDYPGGWADYRIFADGSLRQEARRTSSARALAHSSHCRHFFGGGYRRFALGPLSARSLVVPGDPSLRLAR